MGIKCIWNYYFKKVPHIFKINKLCLYLQVLNIFQNNDLKWVLIMKIAVSNISKNKQDLPQTVFHLQCFCSNISKNKKNLTQAVFTTSNLADMTANMWHAVQYFRRHFLVSNEMSITANQYILLSSPCYCRQTGKGFRPLTGQYTQCIRPVIAQTSLRDSQGQAPA